MKDRRRDALKLEEALIRHHRQAVPRDIPSFLPQKVMAHLREEAMRQKSSHANGSRVSGLVWRFAGVTCLIAILLGVFGIETEVQTQYQFAESMVDDASSLEFVQDLGIL